MTVDFDGVLNNVILAIGTKFSYIYGMEKQGTFAFFFTVTQ